MRFDFIDWQLLCCLCSWLRLMIATLLLWFLFSTVAQIAHILFSFGLTSPWGRTYFPIRTNTHHSSDLLFFLLLLFLQICANWVKWAVSQTFLSSRAVFISVFAAFFSPDASMPLLCCCAVIISDSSSINEVCEMLAHFLVLSAVGGLFLFFWDNKINSNCNFHTSDVLSACCYRKIIMMVKRSNSYQPTSILFH